MMRIVTLALLALAASCAEPAPAADDPPAHLVLQDTHWVMVLDGAREDARAPTLEFAEQARAGGFSGCNQWFAQVDQSNGGLRFGAIGMTRRACPEPAMTLEHEFGALLGEVRSAQREDDELVLIGENAQPLARFTPAP